MREHTLSSTGGLTYAEMGQYQSADNPTDPKGTNDPEAAAKDENGQPISNSARNIWITETALATALDMGFMSEMLSIFSVVVGFALLLTGIGLVILAFAVFGRLWPVTRTVAASPVLKRPPRRSTACGAEPLPSRGRASPTGCARRSPTSVEAAAVD